MIAKQLPGRTDNEIKNFCNSKLLKKKLIKERIDSITHKLHQANYNAFSTLPCYHRWEWDNQNALILEATHHMARIQYLLSRLQPQQASFVATFLADNLKNHIIPDISLFNSLSSIQENPVRSDFGNAYLQGIYESIPSSSHMPDLMIPSCNINLTTTDKGIMSTQHSNGFNTDKNIMSTQYSGFTHINCGEIPSNSLSATTAPEVMLNTDDSLNNLISNDTHGGHYVASNGEASSSGWADLLIEETCLSRSV